MGLSRQHNVRSAALSSGVGTWTREQESLKAFPEPTCERASRLVIRGAATVEDSSKPRGQYNQSSIAERFRGLTTNKTASEGLLGCPCSG